MAKRPTKITAPSKVDQSFKLTEIEGKITEFNNFAKNAGASKEAISARDHAKFLIRDCLELRKEKDLPSRFSAIKQLYDNYNEWLNKLPEDIDDDDDKKNSATDVNDWEFNDKKAKYSAEINEKANKAALDNYEKFAKTSKADKTHPTKTAEKLHMECKPLSGAKMYEIKLSGKQRATFTIDTKARTVTVIQVGGHT